MISTLIKTKHYNMCGICGFIRFDGPVTADDRIIISKMNSRLFHRGPDAQKELLFDNVALGFSRLSIVGLENGMQPIYNEDGNILLLCNGEIFNYVELREDLCQRGHSFATRSDVEVIVHLYEEMGMAFLDKLNGQFALAIYDKRTGSLFCARDHMGICPLYYTVVGKTFLFASEIKAMLLFPGIRKEVDLVGLDQVFTFPGLLSPRTMFRDIRSLENGHFLHLDGEGRLEIREYWDLIYPEGEIKMNGKPEQYYIDRLEELFEQSIRLRLRADVESGVYLSGGLDSSMITMKVNQLYPVRRQRAFSIDFAESIHSETVYQQLVAHASNSALNKKTFYCRDISQRLRQAIYHCECPLKETYNTASLSLSEATRSSGIKVVLCGEGSDELFAGYVGYRFDEMRSMKLIQNHCSPQEEALRERIWGDKSFFYESDFSGLQAIRQELYSKEVNAVFDEVNCLNHQVINPERVRNRGLIARRSYIDYKLRLVDHLVSDHGDKMALANSVEARYPFLDRHFVDFSVQVPASLKLHEFTEKYIIRQMASRFVPQEIREREKFHFVAPGSPYLIQNNIEYVNDLLSYDRIKRQGFFDPDKIESLKKMYGREGFAINIPYESDLLITVITFGILLEEFFNG